MEHDLPDPGFDRVATLDIETTHYKPQKGEVVSIGVGVHEVGEDATTIEYELQHRSDPSVDNETELIKQSLGAVNMFDADGLVSYNGKDFDVWFLEERLSRNGAGQFHSQDLLPDTHIDLLEARKQHCRGRKWPSLEECLAAYELPIPKTVWEGEKLDNTRFGKDLGPRYLTMLADGDAGDLRAVIEHYLRTDLEANFAVFYSDINKPFEPCLLSARAEF